MRDEKSFQQTVLKELDVEGNKREPTHHTTGVRVGGILRLNKETADFFRGKVAEYLCDFGAKVSPMGSETTNHKIKSWQDGFYEN